VVVAAVNEAAFTCEAAPVVRETGECSAVTGGTQVVSDWVLVRISATAGSTFFDRMIALVKGAEHQKTPTEIALKILLAGMTLILVLLTVTIPSFAHYAGSSVPVVVLVAPIPTTTCALTAFSIAKHFAIIPAMFLPLYPQLNARNVMGPHPPQSAIGVDALLCRNLAVCGLGGIAVPLIGFKLNDLGLTAVGLVQGE
jgi:high-affinity K+ transport system ATPase subunit B